MENHKTANDRLLEDIKRVQARADAVFDADRGTDETYVEFFCGISNLLAGVEYNDEMISDPGPESFDEARSVVLKYEDADWIRLVLSGVSQYTSPTDIGSIERARLLAGEMGRQLNAIDARAAEPVDVPPALPDDGREPPVMSPELLDRYAEENPDD